MVRFSLVMLVAGLANIASAADLPEIIHHTTGMEIPITAEQFRHPGSATQPATQPHTRPAPGDERVDEGAEESPRVLIPPPFRSTVFWSRAHELWLYKPDSMRYTPKLDWAYKPRTNWTYQPKRNWTYAGKRDWSYQPRIW